MKMTHLNSPAFVLLMLNTLIVTAQFNVAGTVLDEDKAPVEDASVFINNTSYSTQTAMDGTYSLMVPEGVHELVVYKNGFNSISYKLVVEQPLEVRVNLKPLSVDLEEQQVTADRDPEWYRQLKVFERNFLGESRNGKACELLNPTAMILDGHPKKQYLKGWAKTPLQIRNKHLGYDISYVLETYERDERHSSYVGYVMYRDLPGVTLKRKHLKARERAYKGSTMHFVRSLIEGSAAEEGFEIQKFKTDGWPNNFESVSFEELLSQEEDGVYFKGQGRYLLTYRREKPELSYSKVVNPTGTNVVPYGQVSEMEFREDKVKLLPSGALDPPLGIIFSGYMGWEKVGDALPLDYQLNP